MKAIKPNVLIFSVFQKSEINSVNLRVHLETLQAMKSSGIPVLELQGRYNGVEELSILVSGFEYRQAVEHACKTFNQECYLESNSDRQTFLIYPSGKREFIGVLTSVSKDEAMASKSFSYNPQSGYFIVK